MVTFYLRPKLEPETIIITPKLLRTVLWCNPNPVTEDAQNCRILTYDLLAGGKHGPPYWPGLSRLPTSKKQVHAKAKAATVRLQEKCENEATADVIAATTKAKILIAAKNAPHYFQVVCP